MRRDLQAYLEICNAATPGEWIPRETKDDSGDYILYLYNIWAFPYGREAGPQGIVSGGITRKSDAEFIAASREGWPHAIDRAIKAEAEVERLRSDLNEQYVDENGTAWTRPTAEAYYKACQALDKTEAENTKLRRIVDLARQAKKDYDLACAIEDKESIYAFSLYDNYCRAETLLFEALEDLDKEGER